MYGSLCVLDTDYRVIKHNILKSSDTHSQISLVHQLNTNKLLNVDLMLGQRRNQHRANVLLLLASVLQMNLCKFTSICAYLCSNVAQNPVHFISFTPNFKPSDV